MKKLKLRMKRPDLKRVFQYAKERRANQGVGTLLFVDEIHRFNKSQQDGFLPYVEDGTIILVGATTENPSFEVITPLLSRCQVYVLKSLEVADLEKLTQRAFTTDIELSKREVDLQETEAMFRYSGGDARKLLNIIEILHNAQPEGRLMINNDVVTARLQQNPLAYDKNGELHYDIISAFIKSMRGSDPDAAVHYLARLLEAGDLPSACRRLLVCANEDVGLAYPQIIPIVKAAVDAALMLGMPEARIPLGDVAVLMATSPKSNSGHIALDAALADVRKGRGHGFPRQLQNVHADTYTQEREQGYLYPHDYPNHWVKQQYLPDDLEGTRYYEYGPNKLEQAAKAYWDMVKRGG